MHKDIKKYNATTHSIFTMQIEESSKANRELSIVLFLLVASLPFKAN